jgi:hypothetical protein
MRLKASFAYVRLTTVQQIVHERAKGIAESYQTDDKAEWLEAAETLRFPSVARPPCVPVCTHIDFSLFQVLGLVVRSRRP